MENDVDGRDCESALQERIGYRFRHPPLLRESLTHKSFSNEVSGKALPHNERLEFLGDAVLDLVVSDRIFHAYPQLPEGELTRIRAEVVSERGLASVAREMALGECLLLGRGEGRSGGREKESLLADALEALLGAVFCDGGLDPVRAIVDRLFAPAIGLAFGRKSGIDYKTRLQEVFQGRYGRPPVYVPSGAAGPDHNRVYTVEVRFDAETIGRGSGRTKKSAEQEAAREALAKLDEGE